jgi:neutral ceramidase
MALWIGFGETDITPAPGAEMPGGFSPRHNTGVHDPLHARALFVDDGESAAAIVQVDCLSLKHSVVRRARELASERVGRPVAVMACASHTHSGGPVASVFGSEADEEYLDRLGERIAASVQSASKAAVPARLGIGRGREESVAFNRRFRMRNGRETTHPGKGNPDIVEVAGPIDPEVGVLGAWSEGGEFLGCLVSYTCHCTVMNGLEVSADYPHYLAETVRRVMGGGGVVFVNGAYGDLTQVSNTLAREPEFGEKWARRVGTVLGAEAVKALAAMEPTAGIRVQVADETLALAPRPVPPDQLAAARELLAREGVWDAERWFARELVLLGELNHAEPQVPAEVQAVAIGPAALVGIPGEYFCRFGLEIKERSPFPFTFIAGTANGCVGYIPTAEALGPAGGGYEPRLCRSSKLAPEAGYELREAALRVLGRLEVPAVQASSFTAQAGWDVGASGPET